MAYECVRESVSDLGYGHDDISCMTYDIHVDILLRCLDICDGPLHVHFRLGVAHVGKYNYWALFTPSWDPLSGIGSIQENGAR